MGHPDETFEKRKWQSEIPNGMTPVEGSEGKIRDSDALVIVPTQQFARELQVVEPGILAKGRSSAIRVLEDPGPSVFFNPASGRGDQFAEKASFSTVLVVTGGKIMAGSASWVDPSDPVGEWAARVIRAGRARDPQLAHWQTPTGLELWNRLTDLVKAKTFKWSEIGKAFGGDGPAAHLREAAKAVITNHVEALPAKARMTYFAAVGERGLLDGFSVEGLGPYIGDAFNDELEETLNKTPVAKLGAFVAELMAV